MAAQGLPFKCSRHPVYNPECRYCRNSTGTPILDAGGKAITTSSPATVQGEAPAEGDAWPSLAGLVPYYDRVVVIPLAVGESLTSGLVVPESVRDSYPFGVGRVVAVGSGRIAHTTGALCPLLSEVGDVVVYDKKAGFDLPWEGDTEARCLPEPAIMGRMPRREPDPGAVS